MTKTVKVAVIGAGMMGKNHLKTYKNLQGVELVGVYDVFPEAAKAAAEKGIQVSVLGVGMPDGAPIPVEGTNDYRRDREGNVIVTRLNEAMCQEIAKEGKGIYVRVDNSNSAQKAINQEVNKMAKSDVESKVYTEFNEQFQAIAWVILLLLLAEILILDRKNPLFKNIHLFSNKK